jgi:hypothetical protein
MDNYDSWNAASQTSFSRSAVSLIIDRGMWEAKAMR